MPVEAAWLLNPSMLKDAKIKTGKDKSFASMLTNKHLNPWLEQDAIHTGHNSTRQANTPGSGLA